MVDEMDLLIRMREAEPLPAGAFEEARATLRAAMAVGAAPEAEPRQAPGQARRRAWGTRGKTGVALTAVAAAAAAAVALTVTSSPVPAHVPAAGSRSAGGAVNPPAPAMNPQLARLAAAIEVHEAKLPGNASLIKHTQAIGNRAPQVVWELYADNGAIYATGTESALPAAIAHHANLADGSASRILAVARYAATGNLATARLRMINLTKNHLGLGLSPAAQKKEWAKGLAAERQIMRAKGVKSQPKPWTSTYVQELADNYLWTNSVEALTEGGGTPQVRAGVLRLISTISGVTVANSTTGGQPTLTLTAGPQVFAGEGSQVLTINAGTGEPVKSVDHAGPGVPVSVETYRVSRVTLANIEAGRF